MAINDIFAVVNKYVNTSLTVPLNTLIDSAKTTIVNHVTSKTTTVTNAISAVSTTVNKLQTEANAKTRYNAIIARLTTVKPSLTGTGKTAKTTTISSSGTNKTLASFVAPVQGYYKMTASLSSLTSSSTVYKVDKVNGYDYRGDEFLNGCTHDPDRSVEIGMITASGTLEVAFFAFAGEPIVIWTDHCGSGTVTTTYQQP